MQSPVPSPISMTWWKASRCGAVAMVRQCFLRTSLREVIAMPMQGLRAGVKGTTGIGNVAKSTMNVPESNLSICFKSQ